ncbi:vWA domain-containing protein [Olleya aquimaris]|uniref:VWFA domain-containing protein n=1 Tax=Olleya aquimaris TaxID=639310 RepID=A0A327RL69_9FLAO|nr:hypothetical protein [Olleya aquimaris]RAJ16283.1 hypothetical protein LY08_01141 [Olleya aquimaris]
MKTVLTLLLFLFISLETTAQDQNLETKSVTLDNLIAFVADNFPSEKTIAFNEDDEDLDNEDRINNYQITFLIETTTSNFSSEDEIILKQALKFLSTRLTEEDKLSIVVYSGQNGLLLDNESPTVLKKVLHAISDVNGNLIEDYEDGIGEAYTYATNNLSEEANNLLIMVRNPDAKEDTNQVVESVVKTQVSDSKTNTGSIVLLTAISLLPELIEVIKD